jgi:hypothetical protein
MVDDALVEEPTPLNPRQLRARRRRRRRQLGTLLFLLAAAAILATAYFAVAGDDGGDDEASTTATTGATTTTVVQQVGPFAVTTGVNVRQGPGTSYPQVATIETGTKVLVACVADGEPVPGPDGPDTKWLKLTGPGPQGFVTAVYVQLGDALRTSSVPSCPPA